MNNRKELFNYIVFGILTTLIGIVSFEFFNFAIGREFYLINNIGSWILAVTFAFITNKLLVFGSKDWGFKVIGKEISGFLFARIFSLILEETGLFIMIDLMKFSEFQTDILFLQISGSLIAKIIMQIIVVIVNYIFSKFLIFTKK